MKVHDGNRRVIFLFGARSNYTVARPLQPPQRVRIARPERMSETRNEQLIDCDNDNNDNIIVTVDRPRRYNNYLYDKKTTGILQLEFSNRWWWWWWWGGGREGRFRLSSIAVECISSIK